MLNFCCLNVLVCWCLSNQYNEIACIFSKTFKHSAYSKLTSRNSFIVDVFALGNEKKSKYNKRTLFWHSWWSFDLSLIPYPAKETYMRFSRLFKF